MNKPQPAICPARPAAEQKAPAVFRPVTAVQAKLPPCVQPKATMNFRLETRPAPPVYRLREKVSQLKASGTNFNAFAQKAVPASPRIRAGVSPRAAAIQRAKSSESTSVRLKIKDTWYEGATGKGHGHAEMDALHEYIDAQGGVDNAVAHFKRARGLVVECTEKPVCVRCTQVLKTLGFACSEDTKWGSDSMGSTEWGASMNVKAFLAKYGLDVEKIAK